MRTAVSIAVLAVCLSLALVGMLRGWRGREARTRALVGVPDARPDQRGEPLCPPLPATYVSTTVAGDWLDRVVAHDLGTRSAATVQVHDAGVTIERQGARDLFVPAGDLVALERSGGMAGTFVGGKGLLVLRWTGPSAEAGESLDATPGAGSGRPQLDTGLRMRRAADSATLTAAIGLLLERRPYTMTPEESR
ncbi:MAG TPA: hypothetical protein VGK35_12035 [Actinotalea sp.]|jgi:hypothetical protein